MHGSRISLIAFVIVLALMPAMASAGGKSHANERNKGHHGPVFQPPAGGQTFGGSAFKDKEERERQKAERREALERFLHELHCRVLKKHWPAKWERVCGAGEQTETPPPDPGPTTPPDEPPSDPPPDDPPPPPPTPTGMANFAAVGAVAFAHSANAGDEVGVGGGSADPMPAGSAFAWSDDSFAVSFSRLAGTFMEFRVGNVSNLKQVAATCGTWDTLQVAIHDGPAGATAELRNVMLNGTPLGDLVDNGDAVAENEFWTFSGLSLDAGFTLTASLVVTGWAAESATPARVEFTVGCGA
jgi:hypothetical protein